MVKDTTNKSAKKIIIGDGKLLFLVREQLIDLTLLSNGVMYQSFVLWVFQTRLQQLSGFIGKLSRAHSFK